MDASAEEGFRKMLENQITAVAIVDPTGKIIGCLSSSDIGRVRSIEDLKKSIAEFAADQWQPITVVRSNTLSHVLDLFIRHKVHRVFVVDEHSKPLTVISLCDFIAALWLEKYD